ncbi:cytochrome C oxidase subunit I [Trinickia sp. LjRoot230]|uniref:SCO family protein n=1 Tax=Trinickia sp. LjRoot230 TaxID=3342288 RepID=UPI003ECC75B8
MSKSSSPLSPDPQPPRGSWQRGRWVLLLLALISAAPVIASYLAYYVFKPSQGTTNYGALVQPQRAIPPSLIVTDEAGKPMKLDSLRGVWLMISVDSSACDKNCATKLYFMRQVRATQAGERQRIVMVWLRTDANAVADAIKTAYPDTRMLVADPATVASWLPVDAGTRDTDHIYLVDPNGNLMMRFPKDPNPGKIKGDVTKLLKWSSIG